MTIRRSNRHKGERPIDRSQFYQPYGVDHPVANAIRTGSRWFEAWQFQYAMWDEKLSRAISMSPTRIRQLQIGHPVYRIEVEALARCYGVQPSDIIASLPDPALLAEDD